MEESAEGKAKNALTTAEESVSVLHQPNDESSVKIAASGSTLSFWLLGASIVVGFVAAVGFLFFRLF